MQSVDDMVEHDLSVLDEAEQMDLSQEEQLYYVAMKNLIQVIKTIWSCEGTKLQVSSYFHSRFWKVILGDCHAGLDPPQGLKMGEKLLWKYDETRNIVSFTWPKQFDKMAVGYLAMILNKDDNIHKRTITL